MSSWQPTSVVLVVEHRTCSACRETFITPNHTAHIESRLVSGSLPHRTKLEPIPANERAPAWLPHELRHIHSEVRQCHFCFHESDPRQSDLFSESRQKPTPPTLSELFALLQ